MPPLLIYIANTVCVENFNAKAAMVHLPAVTFNCGRNCPLAIMYVAHKLEVSMLKAIKLM